ncbi:unnamed protein product [Adineta steineri]|uniref:Carbohydrate sulfotransferase n=1 Tax=Adineta steineri TaxID=433720 RepID=A0A819TNC1_9BILA|nr:unnamed protein product [Adineta steineri]CAF4067615.1 unnamed protein product [Adineta steineri]
MCLKIIINSTFYLIYLKKYSFSMIIFLSFLTIFQYRTDVFLTNTKIDFELTQTININSNLSINKTDNSTYLKKCPEDKSPHNIRIYPNQLISMISLVLQSQSLMYCPVPKVATKTLLNVILYIHVRDLINHLNNNWTNIDNSKAKIEKMINISKFIEELRVNGIIIPEHEKPKSLLEFLHMYLNILQFGQINERYRSRLINPWRLSFTFSFPYFRLQSLSNLSQIFSSSFTRTIFVRHPFERLASAYKERIATLSKDRIEPEPEYDAMRMEICYKRVISEKIPSEDSCMNTIPSFEDFVRYILLATYRPNGIARMNFHWQPYSTLCQVCKFQYNFVGKYELFNEDFSQFLKHFNITNWNIEKRNGPSGLKKWDYQKYYTTLSDDLICQLIHLYNDDFRLFKYKIHDYIVNRTNLLQNCQFLKTS